VGVQLKVSRSGVRRKKGVKKKVGKAYGEKGLDKMRPGWGGRYEKTGGDAKKGETFFKVRKKWK